MLDAYDDVHVEVVVVKNERDCAGQAVTGAPFRVYLFPLTLLVPCSDSLSDPFRTSS